MAVTITKPTVGGSEDTWGATINTALDTIVDAVNGTSGTIAPDMTGFDINGVPVTATAAELNILDGVTATTAEINVLDGITATVTELNYVDGVTSAIQTQLDGKQASDATLTALAGVLTAANKIPYATALDTAGELDFKDEDDMASDSATAVPSQQSVKKYVDDGRTNTLVVTEQRSSGVAGVSGAAASWTAYALNTTDYNGITGASVASNQITLPAGTYVIDGFGAAGNGAYNSGTSTYKVRLRNVTDATTAISGGGAASPTYAGNTLAHIENLPVVGQITIAGTKVFELQAWFNGGSSMQMYRAMGSGENEVYAGLKITKIA